jgi:hypothetical protein
MKKSYLTKNIECTGHPLGCLTDLRYRVWMSSGAEKKTGPPLDLISGPLAYNQTQSPSGHQDLHKYQPPLQSFQLHIGPLNLKKLIHANLHKLDGLSAIL